MKRIVWAAMLLAAAGGAGAQQQANGEAAAQIDVKKVFSQSCALCHANYGLDPGRAPKLAGTKLSAREVHKRIADGVSGAMPAFKRTLSPEVIQALTDYIMALPKE